MRAEAYLLGCCNGKMMNRAPDDIAEPRYQLWIFCWALAVGPHSVSAPAAGSSGVCRRGQSEVIFPDCSNLFAAIFFFSKARK